MSATQKTKQNTTKQNTTTQNTTTQNTTKHETTKTPPKERKKEPVTKPQGYGNIYTPHAGSMIIQVQRESGLQNRTIVLSPRQVQLLRFFTSRSGKLVAVLLAALLVVICVIAAQVPKLEYENRQTQHTRAQLDSLEHMLDKSQKNYEQVQRMLNAGASPTTAAPVAPAKNPR